jgi:hypothetical protein
MPHEIIFAQGLTSSAIIARLKHVTNAADAADADAVFAPDDLMPNGPFLDVLHYIVAEHAPSLELFQTTARHLRSGWMFVADGRTTAAGGVIPHRDIVGAFAVRDGCIRAEDYKRNHGHELMTTDGYFRLHEELIARLQDTLLAVNARRQNPSALRSGRDGFFARTEVVERFRRCIDQLERGERWSLDFLAVNLAFVSEAATRPGSPEVWVGTHEDLPPGEPLRGDIVAAPRPCAATHVLGNMKDALRHLAGPLPVNLVNYHVRPTDDPATWDLLGEVRFGDHCVCFGMEP